MAEVKKVATKKPLRKSVQKVGKAKIFIHASFNNTIITVTDAQGNVVGWSSSGSSGFKGSRKSTPYAATVTANKVLEKVRPLAISDVELIVSGIGSGRDAALRAISNAGIAISSVKDKTPIAFNGPRPKKPRRV